MEEKRNLISRTLGSSTFWLLLGLAFIAFGGVDFVYAQAAGYDEAKFGDICSRALAYVQGGFGALLAALAGIGAIVASAAGGFRMAWALLIVSIGAFILKEYLGLFFNNGCG